MLIGLMFAIAFYAKIAIAKDYPVFSCSEGQALVLNGKVISASLHFESSLLYKYNFILPRPINLTSVLRLFVKESMCLKKILREGRVALRKK